MYETGIIPKMIDTILGYGAKSFGGLNSYSLEEKSKFVVTLSDSKIAFGPFAIGIFLAIIIANLEILSSVNLRFLLFKIPFYRRKFRRNLIIFYKQKFSYRFTKL